MSNKMRSMVVCTLYAAVFSMQTAILCVADSEATLDVPAHPGVPDVNATVSKVIDAMEADGQKSSGAIPIPEHHHDKAQRIVARKGVINDGAAGLMKGASPSLNVSFSTSQSVSIVASDEKPTLASTEAPVGKPAPTQSATSSSSTSSNSSNSSSAVATELTGSHSSRAPSSALPVGNATTTSNSTTISASSSTSASSSAPSTLKQPQSKPPAVGGSSTTPRPSTTVSAGSSASTTSGKTVTITTTSSTTIKPPKKPTITYSVEDEPKLLQAAKPGFATPYDPMDSSGRLRVDEPLAQFSKEFIPSQLSGRDPSNSRREYVVPIVTLIFAIPLLLGLFLLSYRRAKEFWLTRHYRRMDFLIDGMYNY